MFVETMNSEFHFREADPIGSTACTDKLYNSKYICAIGRTIC